MRIAKLIKRQEALRKQCNSLQSDLEKSKKDVEHARSECKVAVAEKKAAEKARDEAIREQVATKKKLDDRVKTFSDQVAQHQANNNDLAQKLKDKRNELALSQMEVEDLKKKLAEAESTTERQTMSAIRAVTDYKKSDDFKKLVAEEVGAGLEEIGKSIMAFVDSQAPGIDWSQNPHCALMLDDEEEAAEEDQPGADGLADPLVEIPIPENEELPNPTAAQDVVVPPPAVEQIAPPPPPPEDHPAEVSGVSPAEVIDHVNVTDPDTSVEGQS